MNNLNKLLSEQSATLASGKNSCPTYFISYYQRLASAGTGEYLFDDIPTNTIEVPVNALSEQADFVIGVTWR